MSIFGSLLKTTWDVATTPVDIVKDYVTLGGVLTDQDKPYTVQKLQELGDDVEKIAKDLGEL